MDSTMASTAALFKPRDWLHPDKPSEPVFWIKQIRLLYRLEPGLDAEIRRIKFQRGLNIVWAKPAQADESDPKLRGRGHDVGKTSFCRLIRYLLGEDHYGNEQLRKGIGSRKTLEHAWVVGEINLRDKLWTVGRPLYAGARPFAFKDYDLDAAIAAPASERLRHEDFVSELENQIVSSFAVQTFDDAGRHAIQWLHVLQWLARDQEAHMAGIFKWRDPSSQSGPPDIIAADAQYLVRCILDLTDVKERKEIETRALLGKDKSTAQENIRYFERRISDALQRARDELPGGSDLPAVGEPLFVDVVTQHARKLTEAKKHRLEALLSNLDVNTAESSLEKAIGERALAESRYSELKQLVDETNDSLSRYSNKGTDATTDDLDDLNAIISKLKPDRAYCEIPVSVALFQCPLLQGKRLSADDNHKEPLSVSQLAESKREQIEMQLQGLTRNLQEFSRILKNCKRQEDEARKSRDAIRERVAEITTEITQLDPEVTAWRLRAEDAELSNTRLTETRSEMSQIETKLDESKSRQDEAQKEAREKQIDIEEIFMALCRYFKGDDAEGELRFTRDEIRARIGSGGGAYNALSSIAFDLAALVAHLNDCGNHPGFLIHDSPRESDMELSLYRPLFRLIAELEIAAPDSFQYIITTTETPPDDLAQPPHMVLELDGSKADGFLFREHFRS